jgi:hypothetical protein
MDEYFWMIAAAMAGVTSINVYLTLTLGGAL